MAKPVRIVTAALLGGIVVFLWGAFSHMVLQVGDLGVKPLPNEAVVLPALGSSITEHGMYFFPGMSAHPDEAEQNAWAEKYKAGPRGILVYDPTGGTPMSPTQMGTELVTNIAAAFVAAIIVSMTRGAFPRRALVGAALGLFAWLSVEVSYWNWYMFPTNYLVGALLDQGIGWLVGGTVIAAAVGGPRAVVPV